MELDEILRAFTPETRRQFSVWLDQQGLAVGDNAEAINDALGLLTPFAEQTDEVLKVLNHQSAETRALVRDTGEVFDALTQRQGQLRELIVNSNRVWETTARRDAELADTFRVLPTFLREGRTTTRRLTEFAQDTNPLIDQLRPAARQLSPTLVDLDKLAPDLRGLFNDLDPLVRVSRRGLPATEQVLDNTQPLLRRLDPFLRNFTPIVDYLGLYKARDRRAVRQRHGRHAGRRGHRQSITGEAPLPAHAEPGEPGGHGRLPVAGSRRNRSNPYIAPGGYVKLKTEGHLEVFGTQGCGTTPVPATPAPLDPWLPAGVVAQINYYTFGGTVNRDAAPPCDPQTPLGQLFGQSGQLPAPGTAAVSTNLTSVRGNAFARIVAAVTRRPLAVLAVTALLALGGAALALRLEPSAATDTLVDGDSDSFQATERFKQSFGDDAVVVLVRGELAKTVLTDDLGRVLRLEGCLSGNVPDNEQGLGSLPPVCREIAEAEAGQGRVRPGDVHQHGGQRDPRRAGASARPPPSSRPAAPRGRLAGCRSGAATRRRSRSASRAPPRRPSPRSSRSTCSSWRCATGSPAGRASTTPTSCPRSSSTAAPATRACPSRASPTCSPRPTRR